MSDRCKKRKKRGFYGGQVKKSKYALTLRAGLKGFLCTHNGHPKFCIREAYNTLDKFTHNTGQHDVTPEKDGGDDDFEAELQRDIEKVNTESQKKEFQVVDTGIVGCVFIASTTYDPSEIMEKIITNITESGKCQSRKILRMLPIQVTCKAYLEDIKKAAVSLFDEYFNGEPTSYAIIINRRNNSNVLREELIHNLGLMIRDRNPFHTADLKKPRLTVLVEILKSICCLSVVKNYNDRRKYNLVEIGMSCQRKSNEPNGNSNLDAGETSEVSIGNNNVNKETIVHCSSDDAIVASIDEPIVANIDEPGENIIQCDIKQPELNSTLADSEK